MLWHRLVIQRGTRTIATMHHATHHRIAIVINMQSYSKYQFVHNYIAISCESRNQLLSMINLPDNVCSLFPYASYILLNLILFKFDTMCCHATMHKVSYSYNVYSAKINFAFWLLALCFGVFMYIGP